MSGKMNIDEVIDWVRSIGTEGYELSFLINKYYVNQKDRFISTHIIKGIFKEFLPEGEDTFRSMECDIVTHLN